MRFQELILIVAMVATIVPVIAVLMRGQSHRLVVVATLLTAASACLYLGLVLKVFAIGRTPQPNAWVYLLIVSTLPLLLSAYLFSQSFGREDPQQSLRYSRRTFILLGLVGVGLLALIRQPSFIVRYDWSDGRGAVHLGLLGKTYVCYLLIGIIGIGYNLEKTYRILPTESRYRLRLPIAGLFAVLAYTTCVLSLGMLYSSMGLGKLVACALPMTFCSVAVGHGYLRGALVDVKTPVSRNVVYSSFTALAAALFVLAIGAAAQVASWTHWSPDEILVVAAVFLVALIGGLLLFSSRFQRSVRRYIDRNFYVNRYDYRSQWSSLTQSLREAMDENSVLDRVVPLLVDAFVADDYTIALRDRIGGGIRPRRGKGAQPSSETLELDSPLHRVLEGSRSALLLDRKPSDLTYIPIYAENDRWLDATASQLIAPLLDGGELVGTIGLERGDDHDPFTFEDVALLDSIASHIAASLRSAHLIRELTESREVELISQWSSMLLHDLKNHMAPLRIAAANLVENADEPELVASCARDIDQVADRMENLVHRLSELRQNPRSQMESLCPNELVQEVLGEMTILRTGGIPVDIALQATHRTRGDRDMLRRVLQNLLQNAVEATDGKGPISVGTQDLQSNGTGQVRIFVVDAGQGISEDFLRERLFRPFATTKRKGLGLGLYQCRSIVRNHGGELRVRSELGKGATFEVVLVAENGNAMTEENGKLVRQGEKR